MKKIIASLLVLMMLAACLVSCSDPYAHIEFVENEYAGTTINVYNWGENIANGEDDSLNLEKVFEKKYGINVEYTTYASNEELYTKISSGTVSYDVIVPSDYMIARLIEEDMLQKINFDNIPNYENIEKQYRVGQYYDCAGVNGAAEYSVPYTVGMFGIIYNTEYVDAADVEDQSWGLMWNEKYSGKIIMFNNPRDAFAVSMFYNGINVNTTNEGEWNTVYESLAKQKPLLKGYYMDEIFNQMEGENSYIGVYYAGDCLSMMDNNENLAFYYPVEGTNSFVDAMCIPKNAKNPGAAELFINFMLEEEYAVENALYICYASPNEKVKNSAYYKEELGEDYYSVLYDLPEQYSNEDGSVNSAIVQPYFNLDAATKQILNNLWSKLK
ncbi:MAG: spermidine/putrescine ABC transporter substrate-binding protein [Clostridia bacterium]|nr:spermidine/putrescine ABC transporter substrate-binding protein [Clostridia bacterium]